MVVPTAFGSAEHSLLRDAATGGGLSKFDLVWKPGWDDWRDAGSVEGLFRPPEITLEMPSGGPSPVPTDAPPPPRRPRQTVHPEPVEGRPGRQGPYPPSLEPAIACWNVPLTVSN